MKSAVETLNETRVRLTVEVPFEELQPSLDAAYKKIAAQVNVPGFRKGKVPPQLIDQRFGRAVVLEEAVNDALPRLYTQAVIENNVRVLGQPEVDVKEFTDGQQLTFTADVDIRPDFELPDFADIQVRVDDAEPPDEAVDEELDRLRARFGTLTGVDRPAAAGDFVSIDLAASADGVEIDDAQAKGLSYEIGSGTMLDGLDEVLTGLSAGESATFRSTLQGGSHSGDEVDVSVTVNSIKERQLPELDDEFAQTASEFDTLDELRDSLAERLGSYRRMAQLMQARDRALDALLDRVDLPLPERTVDSATDWRRHNLEHQLEAAGITRDAYLSMEQKTEDDIDAELSTDARRSIKGEFILDAIAERENIGVSESELSEHIVSSAMRYGMNPNDFAAQIVQSGQQASLVGEVRRNKALAHVVDQVKVVDESGRDLDLKALNDAMAAEQDAAGSAAEQRAAEAPAG
ncbi:MAG TPA: trigger factor [Actinomycetes bacterium]|nr:trigger factor [Actinomycetes bacterium]